MNKNELSAAIAAKAGLTRKDAEAALCAMSDIIAESLKNGEKVQIVGFGAFEVKERPARKARNPKTGEEIQIGARRSPMFKPGKALKEAKPIYEYVKGWTCDITACRCVKDMPKELIDYVHRLEELVGCRIRYVSVGAQRDAYIKMY